MGIGALPIDWDADPSWGERPVAGGRQGFEIPDTLSGPRDSGDTRGIDYSTYLGGTRSDAINAIAIGADGVIYVVGGTESLDFLNDGPAARSPGFDGFVLSLSPDGQRMLGHRIVGGSGDLDEIQAIHLLGNHVLIAGTTNSANFPITAGAFQAALRGRFDGFVALLDPSDLTLEYASYIGGSEDDAVTGLAATNSEEVFLAGVTTSPDLLGDVSSTPCRSDADAFILKMSRSLRELEFGLCIGGSGEDTGTGVAVDSNGRYVVATGVTESPDFPVSRAVQPKFGGVRDAFVVAVDGHSGELLSSSFLGGSSVDSAFAVAVGLSEAVYVVGASFSVDFPVTPPFNEVTVDAGAFVSKLVLADPTSATLEYSRLLGGPSLSLGSGALAVTVQENGDPVIVGLTTAADFPVSSAPQTAYEGEGDAFVTTLNADTGSIEFSTFLGGGLIDNPNAVASAGGAIYVGGITESTDFPMIKPIQGTPFRGDAFLTRIVDREIPSSCLYVTNGMARSISVLDVARRKHVGVLGDEVVAPQTTRIAVSANEPRAYVLETRSSIRPLSSGDAPVKTSYGAVAVVDTNTGEILGRFGTLAHPRDLFLSSDVEVVYVVDDQGITAFDPHNGEQIGTLTLPNASRAVPAATFDKAYVLAENHAYVVALPSLEIDRDFSFGQGRSGVDLAVASSAGLILLLDQARGRLEVRDTQSGKVRWETTIDSGGRQIVLSPDESLAFVGHASLESGMVSVVDLSAQSVVASISIQSPVEDLGVTPDGAFLFVATGADGKVWAFDTKTKVLVSAASLGRPAEKVVFGARRGGCQVAAPCDGDCSGDGIVSLDELITLIRIGLGIQSRSTCDSLARGDQVTIEYAVAAVNYSIVGCPGDSNKR